MTTPRWPQGAKAAVSFTMDNLGEAQDVNKGTWPADVPVGAHHSVKEKLPRMLDLLGQYGVKVTYFAESWSLGVYPAEVEDMMRRGHEIAWHGYQHEVWNSMSEEEELENFRKSFEKAAEYGIKYEGFRPPGGSINERTYALLHQYGVKYISPLGDFGTTNGIAMLPFEWKAVDAFYYMEKFAGIREGLGEKREVLSPLAFEEYLLSAIEKTVDRGGYMSILFHPFLTTDDKKIAVMEKVLETIRGDPRIWCAPCKDVARWVSDEAA